MKRIGRCAFEFIVLYRILVAASMLVFATAYISILLGHLIIPWFIEMPALWISLHASRSCTSRPESGRNK